MNIQQLAQQFNLDEKALEEMTLGVYSRVQHAIENGAVFSDELVSLAIEHYIESRRKHTQELLDNEEKFSDFCSQVYDRLAA